MKKSQTKRQSLKQKPREPTSKGECAGPFVVPWAWRKLYGAVPELGSPSSCGGMQPWSRVVLEAKGSHEEQDWVPRKVVLEWEQGASSCLPTHCPVPL